MSAGQIRFWFGKRPKRFQETAPSACSIARSQATGGSKDRFHFLEPYMEPLLVAGWFERTLLAKPQGNRQLTEKGRQVNGEWTGGA